VTKPGGRLLVADFDGYFRHMPHAEVPRLWPQVADLLDNVEGDVKRLAGALPPLCALCFVSPGFFQGNLLVRWVVLVLTVVPAGGRSPLAGLPGHNRIVTPDSGQ